MQVAIAPPPIPVGKIKSFGPFGPKYEVGHAIRQLDDGDWMRLTDWITVAVEAYMSQQLARVVPPPRIGFCGSAPGARGRRQRQFRRRRAAAHLPIELMQSEDNVAGLNSLQPGRA